MFGSLAGPKRRPRSLCIRSFSISVIRMYSDSSFSNSFAVPFKRKSPRRKTASCSLWNSPKNAMKLFDRAKSAFLGVCNDRYYKQIQTFDKTFQPFGHLLQCETLVREVLLNQAVQFFTVIVSDASSQAPLQGLSVQQQVRFLDGFARVSEKPVTKSWTLSFPSGSFLFHLPIKFFRANRINQS